MYVQEVKKFENIDQLEEFMLKHGETIVDMLGGEIDRIEMKLRVRIFLNIYTIFQISFQLLFLSDNLKAIIYIMCRVYS